jgi:peptidoglycan-associated lipoprotein
MFRIRHRSTILLLGSSFLAIAALSSCGYVKRDDMDARLAQMQAQMEADRAAEIADGDRQVTETLNGRLDGIAARLDALQREISSMEEEFNARVEELETALRFDVPVYFGFDEDEVTPEYMAFLDRFAEVVNEYYPSSLVTAEGFTDPVGTPEYNLALGKRRAQAVADYLVEQGGLSSDRVRAVSYGESTERLVAANSHGPGPEGWENRRVALVIDHSGD